MNILFLTLSHITDIHERSIYNDLVRELMRRGHSVYIASPTERRYAMPTQSYESNGAHILNIKTLNIQKTNIIEKGIGTLIIEYQFDYAISKYWSDIKFDLVLYSTPPITFNRIIAKVKRRCGARSYLMLKDIFPQNAVDLGIMKEGGLLHRIFRRKEKQLYELSDRIGCMSPANCRYVIKHNTHVDPVKVEICPNAIEVMPQTEISIVEKSILLSKYGIPFDKTLFIYGGNLGKPQGLEFLINVLAINEKRTNSFIVIVGSGTEYPMLSAWFDKYKPYNSKLVSTLEKKEYDRLVGICDVGLVFLHPKFTIPNFPSRILSYLENKMPVLLATDINTDVGKIAEDNGFGFWCENGDIERFIKLMDKYSDSSIIKKMGQKGYEYLINNYQSSKVCDIILN